MLFFFFPKLEWLVLCLKGETTGIFLKGEPSPSYVPSPGLVAEEMFIRMSVFKGREGVNSALLPRGTGFNAPAQGIPTVSLKGIKKSSVRLLPNTSSCAQHTVRPNRNFGICSRELFVAGPSKENGYLVLRIPKLPSGLGGKSFNRQNLQ